ncbi:MAG: hypothetical protein ACREQA_03345 [Candidatus Binatia bacterium]
MDGTIAMNQIGQISMKAVLLGTLVDIGGTGLASVVIATIVGVILALLGVSEAEVDARLIQSYAFLIGGLIVGLGFTFLGGLVAARLAKAAKIMHSSAVGVIGLLLALVFYSPMDFGAYPLWYRLTALILMIPIATLGGYIAEKTREEVSV